jgi:hypothetical protein
MTQSDVFPDVGLLLTLKECNVWTRGNLKPKNAVLRVSELVLYVCRCLSSTYFFEGLIAARSSFQASLRGIERRYPMALTVHAVYGRHLPFQAPRFDENSLKSGKNVIERRRLNTLSSCDDEVGPSGPDFAYFVPVQGLLGHDMYHTEYHMRNFVFEERAVLLQSVETYRALCKSKVGKYFHMHDGKNDQESLELILAQPSFGEQLIVEGCEPSQLCIGDVFEVLGGISGLKLEVTSPRLPCQLVDRKVGSPFGGMGVKRHTLDEAAAGWFCRVLREGQVRNLALPIECISPYGVVWWLTQTEKYCPILTSLSME